MASKTNETIIELKSITKRYGLGDTETFALHNFDLTVKRGEFIMIMGPSGCGKTTLLNIIGLLDKATIGEYKLVGKSVDRISARKKAQFRAKEIGFIFQSFNLISNLTVIDNVTMPLVYSGVHKTRRLKMADKILERYHSRRRAYRQPRQPLIAHHHGRAQRHSLPRQYHHHGHPQPLPHHLCHSRYQHARWRNRY